MLKTATGQLTLLLKAWIGFRFYYDTHMPFNMHTHPFLNMCLHMQIHRHTQMAAQYMERLFTVAVSLLGFTMLLFSLLAWGELAQVELMDLKVVGWLVVVGGNCLGGK